jgi:hypothetical protein
MTKNQPTDIDFFQLDFSDEADSAADPIELGVEPTEAVELEEPIEATDPIEPVETATATEPIEEDEVIKANFEFLRTKGALLLPEDYEFEATEEGFEKAVADADAYRQEAIIAEMFSAMPQQGKELLQYYLNGGTDVQAFVSMYSEPDITTVDLEDEDAQERIVKQLFKETTRFSDAKIQKIVDSYKDDMRLKEEAEEAIPELTRLRDERRQQFIEEERIKDQKLKAQAAQARQELYTTLSGISDINGIPYSKEDVNKTMASIYNPVKLTDGSVTTMFNYRLQQTLADPKKIALLNKLMEEDFKFDFITRKKTSAAANILKNKLKESQKFKGSAVTPSGSGFDFNAAKLDLT